MAGETLVSVIVLTYNHAVYIDQCLESILAQKTDFPFEIIVSDDASTDGTPELLKNWAKENPRIKLSLLSENGGPAKNFRNALQKCGGKYISYCEGDDFWADSNKMQTQVENLEKNPDLSIVFSNYGKVDSHGTVLLEKVLDTNLHDFSIADFIDGHGPVLHASTLRRSIFPERLSLAFFTVHNPDVFILGWALIHGKSKYIDSSMSMYRVHSDGIYSSLTDDEKRLLRYSTRLKFFDSLGGRYKSEYAVVLERLTQALINIRENGNPELYRKYFGFLPFSVRLSLLVKRFYGPMRS